MFVLILFLQILGSLSIDPRAVQVNLETSFVFRQKDINKQNTVINGLKALLVGLEKHFRSRKSDTPVFRSQNSDGELTTFFRNLGQQLVEQSDDYLRNITKVLIKVTEDYHKRSKFNSMFDDEGVKNYVLNNNLNRWIHFSPDIIRSNIQYALDNDDTIFHKLVQFADRVFNETDRAPLAEIARDLAGVNKKRKNIAKVIKGAFNFIIFKKIHSLSGDKKDLLRKALRKLVYGYNKLDEEFDERQLDSNINIKVDSKGISAKITKPSKAETEINEPAEDEKEKLSEVKERAQETKEKVLEINETAKDVKAGRSEVGEFPVKDEKESHSEITVQAEEKDEKHLEINEQAANEKAKSEKESPSEIKENKNDEKDKLPETYEHYKDKKETSSEINKQTEDEKEKPQETNQGKSGNKSEENIKHKGEALLTQIQKEVRRMTAR